MQRIKNRFLTIMLLVAGLAFTSCSEKLELKPFDAIGTDIALQTPSDFENAIRGVNFTMLGYNASSREGHYYGGRFMSLPDILADNLILNQTGRTSLSDYFEWDYDANRTWQFMFFYPYKAINFSNVILENLDVLLDEGAKNNIRGEALAARAICHFDMMRVFCQAPITGGEGALGIPYKTTSDVTEKPSRPTLGSNFVNVLDDLNTAAGLINDNNGVGRMNKATVYAALSRVHLYMGNNGLAIEASNNAISAAASLGTSGSVASLADFPSVWSDNSEAGVLFKLLVDISDDLQVGNQYNQSLGASGLNSEYNVDFAFFNMFDSSDGRLSTYIQQSPFIQNGIARLYNHVVKYNGGSSGGSNVNDIKVFRMAEVYLNKAEAHAALNQDVEALGALDAVRSKRYTGFVTGNETGQALKDAIDKERRLELAFEGDRFFTFKRKGLDIARSSFGDEADGTGISAIEKDLSVGPLFALPLPNDEFDANANMVQNPGY